MSKSDSSDDDSIFWPSSLSSKELENVEEPIGRFEDTAILIPLTVATSDSEKERFRIDIPESSPHSIEKQALEEQSYSQSPMHQHQLKYAKDKSGSPSTPMSPNLTRRRVSSQSDEDFVVIEIPSAAKRRLMLTPDSCEGDDSVNEMSISPDHSPRRRSGSAAMSHVSHVTPTISNNTSVRMIDNVRINDTIISTQKPQPKFTLYKYLFYWSGDLPIFIFLIYLINWIFFIWGIVGVIGWDNAQISLTEPVSPPLQTFPFLTVNFWPSCTSARGNTWRLMSAQFTHAGIQHIGGNTLAGVIYGGVLESTHPYHWLITGLVYEMACIFGCLGHSYVWPFEGLIGCSTGVYGLIGCMISHIILDYDSMRPVVYWGIVASLFFQGLYDTVTYYVWYNPNIAYAAHCTSFFIGIFLGLSFGVFQKPIWKKAFGYLGLAAFLVLSISLIVHFNTAWPPAMLPYNPTFHPYNRRSCCGELYTQVNSTFSLEQARQSFSCNADGTINNNWHKS